MKKQNECRETICKWASADLSNIGNYNERTLMSLKLFVINVYTGFKQVYDKDVGYIIVEWAENHLPQEVVNMIADVITAYKENDTYQSTITDLLRDKKFPCLPRSLQYNDYIPMEELINKLQETFQ